MIAGEITTEASSSCNFECEILYGSLFTQQATVLYAGASPGFASGFTEVVFVVPTGASGSFSFSLSVMGVASNPVTLYVTSP